MRNREDLARGTVWEAVDGAEHIRSFVLTRILRTTCAKSARRAVMAPRTRGQTGLTTFVWRITRWVIRQTSRLCRHTGLQSEFCTISCKIQVLRNCPDRSAVTHDE